MHFQERQNFQSEQEQESFEQTCIFCHRIPQEIISLTCRHDFCLNCALKEVPNQDGEIPQNFFCKFCKQPTHLSEDLRQILIMLEKKNKNRMSNELPSRDGKFKSNCQKFGKLEKIFEVDSNQLSQESQQTKSIDELKSTPNFKMDFNQNSKIEQKITLKPFSQNNFQDIPKSQKFLRQSDLFYKKSTNTNQTEENFNVDKDIKPQTILEGLELSNEFFQQDNRLVQQVKQGKDDIDNFQKSDEMKKSKIKKGAKVDLQKLLQSLELKTKKGKSLQKTKQKNSSSKNKQNKSQKKFFLSSKKNQKKKSSFKKKDICKTHKLEYQILINEKKVCVKCHNIQKKKIENESKSLRQNVTKEIEHEFQQKKKLLQSLLNHSCNLQEQFIHKIDNMKKKGQLFYEQIKLSLEKEYKQFIEEVSILERKIELNFEEYKIDISDKLNDCKKYMLTLQKTKPIDYYIEKKNKFEKSLLEENINYSQYFIKQQEYIATFFKNRYYRYGQNILKKFESSSNSLFKFQFSNKINKETTSVIIHYFGLDSDILQDKIYQIKELGENINNIEQQNQKFRNSSKNKKHKKKSSSNKRTTTRKSFKKFSKHHKSQKQF